MSLSNCNRCGDYFAMFRRPASLPTSSYRRLCGDSQDWKARPPDLPSREISRASLIPLQYGREWTGVLPSSPALRPLGSTCRTPKFPGGSWPTDWGRPLHTSRDGLGVLCYAKISIRRTSLSLQRRATRYHSLRALRCTIGCAVRRGRVPCNARCSPVEPDNQSPLVSARLDDAQVESRIVACGAWP